MPDKLVSTLEKAAASVFEVAAFMTVLPVTEVEEPLPPDQEAMIRYSGAHHGSIILRMHAGVLDTIAEDVLAENDRESQGEARQETLKELLNMICGCFLADWCGSTAVFDLSPPVIIESPENEAFGISDVMTDQATTYRAAVEGSLIEILVAEDEQPHIQ